MHHQTPTDEELGVRLQNGDPDAPGLIYERFKSGLYRFCLRLLTDSDGAQDVVHETIVIMITRRNTLKAPSSLKSWLYAIARNESFAMLRSRRYTESLNGDEEYLFEQGTESDPVEQQERSALLAVLLDRMLPQYKEVLMLREYEGMNYEEIAAVTGATVSSVKSRLFKARRTLSEKLQPQRKRGDV